MKINRLVLDLSHHETVDSYYAMKADGIAGIIYKATQGISYHDPTYRKERARALKAGMLWGSYHFMEKGNVTEQVRNYLDYATPEPAEIICLDFEDYDDNTPTLDQAKLWVQGVESELCRVNQCLVYSGNTLKEALGDRIDSFWGAHRLWLAQYGTKPSVQKSWNTFWLWQYSDGENGPEPHDVDGTNDLVDSNSFNGTAEELATQWSGGESIPVPPEPIPEKATVKIVISAPTSVNVEVSRIDI